MSALHEFDLWLCSYVHYNISRHFEDAAFFKAVASTLSPELVTYLGEDIRTESGDFRPILLDFDDLMRLHRVIDVTSFKHGRRWTALGGIHKFSTRCTGEIQRRLAPAEARKWAEDSEHYSSVLEHHPLSLSDGIWTVQEWIGELRRYMEAMGDERLVPAPTGHFPTPTDPTPIDDAGLAEPQATPVAQGQSAEPHDATGRKKKGGRPPMWDDLWEMAQDMKAANPEVSDGEIAAKYNQRFGKQIGQAKRKRATAEIIHQLRHDRTKRKPKS